MLVRYNVLRFNFYSMTTLTIRVDDQLKKAAFKAAEKLGVPLTLIVKNALKQFIEEPRLVIGNVESLKVTKDIQEKMDLIAKELKKK